MRIQLQDMFGPKCVALGDGHKLFDEVYPHLKEKKSVELDFTGIDTLFSPFLMGCIGKLFNYFEKETLMQRLVPCNISQENLKTFNEFLDRADRQDTEQVDRETMESLFEEDELGDI